MNATVTDFLKVFKVADGDSYDDYGYGDEMCVELVDCNSVNATYHTYENLVLPKVDDSIISELAHNNIDTYCEQEEVISYLTEFFNENADTEGNEYVGCVVYSTLYNSGTYECLLKHFDAEAVEMCEDKVYDFGYDTLAEGVMSCYNKRCEVGFTLIKPYGSYGKVHNWQLFVTDGYFVDACLADCGSKFYHFNSREVAKLIDKVNVIRRTYSDNEE